MISISNLEKTYGGKVKALKGISLEVKKGEIFGFLGPNGAGKTTAINIITGIIKPDNGKVLVNGIDISQNPIESKKQIGFVPDSPDIFLKLKGIEYLNFMADVYEVDENVRKQRIIDLSQRFSMEDALQDRISSYSHGMRQKIIIMGVLIHNPNVWILDEPMTGLDPKSSYTLKEMMREHCDQGNSVFFSTHVLEVAEKLCDRVAVINNGEILFAGNLEEMKQTFKSDESLEKIFLEITNG